MITASWKSTTNSSYQTHWKRWVEYAEKHKINGDDPSESELANYFASMSGSVSATTVSNARSAIGQTLELMRGKDALGPLTDRVVSGARKQKPPQPRYDSIWSYDDVFEHVRGWGADLDFSKLTNKLIVLLTFEFYARPSDLAKIVFSSVKDEGAYLTLQLAGPKEQKGSAFSAPITIRAHLTDPLLCPVLCLRSYIDQSRTRRSQATPDHLLLSQKKSTTSEGTFFYDVLGSQRISNLMKAVLQSAGINTAVWKGGSGRAAAASTSKECGVSLKEILDRGRWARESTFRRFYDKRTVLQTSNPKSSEASTEGELDLSSKA